MDKFDQYEQDGRALFKSILDQCNITDQQPAKDKYDNIDYYYTTPYKLGQAGVEIKKRDIKYKDYSTLLMEVSKFKAIAARVQSKELDRAYYVNFIGDDTAYIFNIRDIARGIKDNRVQITTRFTNITTADDQGKTEKRVLLIPKSLGFKLVRQGNLWVKSLKNK